MEGRAGGTVSAGDSGTAPSVAIVIGTRRRETRLAFALEALAEQTYPLDLIEVVVVRDGDDAEQRARAPEGLRLEVLTMPDRRSAASKRNAGWHAVGADLIVFTDDDCRPSSTWIEELVAAWQDAGGGMFCVIQGAVKPDPDELHLLTGLARSLSVDEADGWFQTANLALPRSLLERVGGFDERFARAAGEDTDLGLRAIGAGARSVFAHEAVVWHAVHTLSLPAAVRDVARADQVAELIRLHPDQRRRVFCRIFWKRSHALVTLGLAGAVLGRRRRVALLAGVPYAVENYDTSVPVSARHVAGVALHLPARFLVDLAELAQTVRGAIRSRTLLL
jgi:GT2 family glycosyltransferase